MDKTKKQHYVPQCYLEKFRIRDTCQVHVYDKKKRETRTNSIKDIAEENFFHDIKFSDVLPEDILDDLKRRQILVNDLDNEQFIENYLANTIEGKFKDLLGIFVQRINHITPWIADNCHFFSEFQKSYFSKFLAIQFIRTKSVRQGIAESSDCLLQMLDDMNAPQHLRESVKVTKEDLKYIHGSMILDNKHLMEIALLFNRLTWILGINTTPKLFYTSDAPIGTKAHLSDPIISMSVLSSKGVEAFFPITPNAVLIMFDGDYHNKLVEQDRKYWIIADTNNVDYYNSLSVIRSYRCVYSTDGDFTLIDEMLKRDSKVFDCPRTDLLWGGKSYRPRII